MIRRQRSSIARHFLLAACAALWGASPAFSQATDVPGMPVGVFDSGTGGLAVLEQILRCDLFDNHSGAHVEGGDGLPDFQHERFIFLADQANMPYGDYPARGKTQFLEELILWDARFLLGTEPFASPRAANARRDKSAVKAIMIACNTATAFGLGKIQSLVAAQHLDFPVVGVIDAGAAGAVDGLPAELPGSIGVMATQATVASGAYPATIRRLADQRGLGTRIDVFQHAGLGVAGAIDGAPEFIAAGAPHDRPRPDYRGPSLKNPESPIHAQLLPRYAFDYSEGRMIVVGSRQNPTELQLNSVDNYIKYHLVSLLETIRTTPGAKPLRVMVLGCTHFPFFLDTFRAELARLYDYQEDGRYVYRPVMAQDVILVDPAQSVAEALYRSLADRGTLAASPRFGAGQARGEFYITIPARANPAVQLNDAGWFTYEYKYGRTAGMPRHDYFAVPLTEEHLGADVARRLAKQVPAVWELVADFLAQSAGVSERALAPAGGVP